MTKATDKSAEGKEAGTPVPYLGMTAFNGDLIAAYVQTNQAILDCALTLNQEMARFANERLQSDVRVLQSLPNCTNWEDVLNLQSDVVRSTMEAYFAELPRMAQQATSIGAAMCGPIFESAKVLTQGSEKS